MYTVGLRSALPEKGQRPKQFTWRKQEDHVGSGLAEVNEEEPDMAGPAWRKFHPLPRPDALAQQAVAEVTSMAREALIMESGEKMAIAQRGPAEYLVDNSALQAHAPGITFRFSKHLEDRDDLGELAAFGSVVLGIDEGDGWLRAQNPSGEIRFLPMEIQGIPVMSRTGAEEQREAFAERRRRKEEAERHQRDLEAWQRRAAEAERLHQERLRAQAERDEKEQSKADLLKPERSGFKGRTESVLERHYAGEEEEAPDHYQVLGVPRHASQEEINQAYRALSKPLRCNKKLLPP
ncbi:C3H1-type domain-containing protein [Durusdinium trenchii]|uniref:C3H1-type domain-containing protein n=1 Tax=Durusdinium trenchii TaxID=1381693 RepID=A0ABP0QVG4_9DINO